tara:strand:+ start:555 stop:1667 length:1113 start_codon:yes stop_codon:yes gene_type:complete
MSHRRTTPSTIELLLIDYIHTIREQSNQQTRMIGDYLHTVTRQSNNVRNLITRWIDLVQTTETREYTNTTNNAFNFTPSTATPTVNVRSRNTFNRSFSQSPINYVQSSNFSTNRRRRTNRITRPVRTRRRNLLNQILETTLYTPINRRPATAADISRNITTTFWRDISNSTDQTLDPITQEHFQHNDSVSRIDYCGHLFMEDALNTYLTEFDHRCPICRYNISNETFPPVSYSDATARPPPLVRQNAFDISPFDLSYNLQNFPPLDIPSNLSNLTTSNLTTSNLTTSNLTSTTPPTFEFDLTSGNFDNAINQLSNAMLSSISNALTNPDNSGNVISAEYSLFVPTTTQVTDNATSTEDIPDNADTEDETY